MTEPACAGCREQVVELALGLVTGRERADALAHLQACPGCREHLAALTRLHDELRALIPAAEPPVGFETRVIDRLVPARPWRHRRRLRIAAAAGVVAALFACGWTLHGLTGPVAPSPTADVPVSGGPVARGDERAVLFAPLVAGDREVGQVYAYPGTPSWVYLYLDAPTADGPLTCAVLRRDGTTSVAVPFPLVDGDAFWGGPVPIDRATLAGVRITDSTGTVLAAADLTGPP